MHGNAAERRIDDERPSRTSSVRRALETLAIALSVTYAGLNLVGFERNFILYLANVIAPVLAALLVLTLAARAALRLVPRAPLKRQRLLTAPEAALLAALLVPVAQGELRRGGFAAASVAAVEGEFSVLDANLLGPVNVSQNLLDEIVRREPDIVLLQELNPAVSERLTPLLAARYPCRVLNPQNGTTGMAVYSRFPCEPRDLGRAYFAAGLPQLVTMTLPSGKKLAVGNVHTNPPHVLPPAQEGQSFLAPLSETVALREAHTENILAELASMPADARILGGDFNATVRNRIYGIARNSGMQDSWSASSRFAGGTWPNTSVSLVRWLLRLDFLFCSPELAPLSAENLSTAGGSDHRGLFVRLGWRRKG